MPQGQWVAFDGRDSVHKCPQKSQYEDLVFPSDPNKKIAGKPSDQKSSYNGETNSQNEHHFQPIYKSIWFWLMLVWLAFYLMNQ